MIVDVKGDVFLPPKSVVLRNVTLWGDYFLRWSPSASFTHYSFVAEPLIRLGTLGGAQFNDKKLDTSFCTLGDLKLTEATGVNAEWEAHILSLHVDLEKWRAKALHEKMAMMMPSTTTEVELVVAEEGPIPEKRRESVNINKCGTLFDDLDMANAEVIRLRALLDLRHQEQDRPSHLDTPTYNQNHPVSDDLADALQMI